MIFVNVYHLNKLKCRFKYTSKCFRYWLNKIRLNFKSKTIHNQEVTHQLSQHRIQLRIEVNKIKMCPLAILSSVTCILYCNTGVKGILHSSLAASSKLNMSVKNKALLLYIQFEGFKLLSFYKWVIIFNNLT